MEELSQIQLATKWRSPKSRDLTASQALTRSASDYFRTESDSPAEILQKLELKEKEVELLYEEIANLKHENDDKQGQMDSLVGEVQNMLSLESNKMSNLEGEVQRLQIENERLKKELQAKGGVATPRGGGPTGELSTHTIANYIKHTLGEDKHLTRKGIEIVQCSPFSSQILPNLP